MLRGGEIVDPLALLQGVQGSRIQDLGSRIQVYKDYKTTRLQDYKTTKTTRLHVTRYRFTAGCPTRGPADIKNATTPIYIYIYVYIYIKM